MNLSSLAALIERLTHLVDRLEVFCSTMPVYTRATQERHDVLVFEIVGLHSLIDTLNMAYTELEAEMADRAFEAVGQ